MSTDINNYLKNYNYQMQNSSVKNNSGDQKVTGGNTDDLLKMTMTELLSKFQRGELSINEVTKWCGAHGCQLSKTSSENRTIYNFQYQGKNYSISSNQTNNVQNSKNENTYTFEQLKYSYGLDSSTISRFFNQTGSNSYVFRADCGFLNVEQLLQNVYKYGSVNNYEQKPAERQNYAYNKVNEYKKQLTSYSGAAENFSNRVSSEVNSYINGKITKDAFDKNLKTVFDSTVREVKQTEERQKNERQSYAYNKISEFKKQLSSYSGAGDKFSNRVSSEVNSYINGKINKDVFNNNLYTMFNAVVREVKLAEENQKNERRAYAYNKVNEYKKQLTSYSGADNKLSNRVSSEVNSYINNKITKDTFDKNLKTAFDSTVREVKQTEERQKTTLLKTSANETAKEAADKAAKEAEAKAAKEAQAVKEKAEKEAKERQTYANNKVNEYKKQLASYSGAESTFSKKISADVTNYTNGKITKNEFDKKVSDTFNNLKLLLDLTGKITNNTTLNKNSDGTYTVTINYSDGRKTVQKYNAKKLMTSETQYDKNGKVATTVSKTYDNANKITKKVTKNYNSDGSYTTYTYNESTGTVTRKDYDANGNDKTVKARTQINTGKISKSGVTKTTQQMYDAITSDLDKKFCTYWGFTVTTEEAMREIGGDLSVKLIKAAQAGEGKPRGSQEYGSIKSTGFEDYITKRLKNALKSTYGYDPEDVKGYQFSKYSNMADSMAGSSEMKTFVKNNIKDLIAGKGLPKGMQFTKGDLYYAVSKATVLSAELSGKKLTLKVFDIYDFDQSYITKLNSSSGGSTVLNAAGAAAMKDGKLKPYYHITNVEIDLTKIFSSSELKSLGIK